MRSRTRSRSRHRSPTERRRRSRSKDRRRRSRSNSNPQRDEIGSKDRSRRQSESRSPNWKGQRNKGRSYRNSERTEDKHRRRSQSRSKDKDSVKFGKNCKTYREDTLQEKATERWPNDKYRENESKDRTNNPFRGQPTANLPPEDRPRHGFGYKSNYRNEGYMKKDTKYLQQRREEREKIGIMGVEDVWGKSPSHPEKYSDDEDDDVQLLEHTYQGPKKKKSKKGKKKSSKKSKKNKKSKKKKKTKSKKKEMSSSSESSSEESSSSSESSSDSSNTDTYTSDSEEEIWVEKTNDSSKKLKRSKNKKKPKKLKKKSKKSQETGGKYEAKPNTKPLTSTVVNEEDDFGPTLRHTGGLNQKDFGRALLPGEGAAMAAYIAEGKRIPRRGEIGLTSEEIATFESVGYVMSGSRHRRMEAVRIRKENQIYSADEKRALAMFSKEERQKRENKILSQFKDMVNSKLHAKEKK
ncbi:NKAP family protein CG6066 [Stomoxys calcitrans]|uniref:NF-kappa-B-activating protein C-terminal domain-containing protein n=1 Tax=Stomoxys calcitrans TaxID=35570 RepID=A0A1I8PL07_STOCA|nr:NKAP family protein CG6066 [Stomoxys calcitrans]